MLKNWRIYVHALKINIKYIFFIGNVSFSNCIFYLSSYSLYKYWRYHISGISALETFTWTLQYTTNTEQLYIIMIWCHLNYVNWGVYRFIQKEVHLDCRTILSQSSPHWTTSHKRSIVDWKKESKLVDLTPLFPFI